MKREPIFIPYRVYNPQAGKYQVNMKNDIVRNLLSVFRRQYDIPYYSPLSDSQRMKFEKLIIRSGIDDNDGIIMAVNKFKTTLNTPERGYTSADVQRLKNDILGKAE